MTIKIRYVVRRTPLVSGIFLLCLRLGLWFVLLHVTLGHPRQAPLHEQHGGLTVMEQQEFDMSSPVTQPKPFNAFVTFCATDDLTATATFYEQVLGLELALDQGTCRIYRVAGCGFLGFCSREDAPRPDGIILTLVTDDVDGWFKKVEAAGVVVDKAPAFNPKYNITHCFVRDPNGYKVEIQRFDDPRWPG